MISAIVIAPDDTGAESAARVAEIVVRSMAWLVTAVVAGVVRDVTLAAPAGLGLSALADQAGCALVQAERETCRLSLAVAEAQGPQLLVMKAGFQPETGLIDELDDLVRHETGLKALIRMTPSGWIDRLVPNRTRIIGFVAPADLCRRQELRSFKQMAAAIDAPRALRHRATSIL